MRTLPRDLDVPAEALEEQTQGLLRVAAGAADVLLRPGRLRAEHVRDLHPQRDQLGELLQPVDVEVRTLADRVAAVQDEHPPDRKARDDHENRDDCGQHFLVPAHRRPPFWASVSTTW